MTPQAAHILRTEYLQLLLWSGLLRDGERVPVEAAASLRARTLRILRDCRTRLGTDAGDPYFQRAEKAVVAALDDAAIRRFKDDGDWEHVQLELFGSTDQGTEVLKQLDDLTSYVPHETPLELLKIYDRCIALGYGAQKLKRTSEALRCAIAQRIPVPDVLSPDLGPMLPPSPPRWLGPTWIGVLAALLLVLLSMGVRSALDGRVEDADEDIRRHLLENSCR